MRKTLEAAEIRPNHYAVIGAIPYSDRLGRVSQTPSRKANHLLPRVGLGVLGVIGLWHGTTFSSETPTNNPPLTNTRVDAAQAPNRITSSVLRLDANIGYPTTDIQIPNPELTLGQRLAQNPMFVRNMETFVENTKGAKWDLFAKKINFSGVNGNKVRDLPNPGSDALGTLYEQEGEWEAHALIILSYEGLTGPITEEWLIVDSQWQVTITADGVKIKKPRLGFLFKGFNGESLFSTREAKTEILAKGL